MNNGVRRALQVLAAASMVMAPAIGIANGNDDDDDPPIRELTAQWWQWALSIPTGVNPLKDLSGANCMVGQRGSIWFLAGPTLFDFTAVTRHCSVPQGVTLFFPIVNSVQVNTPNACGQTGPYSVAFMRGNNAGFIDKVTKTTLTLDSIALRGTRRVVSVPFVSALPADNIFVDPCNDPQLPLPHGQPPGVFSPSVDDGYYAKIEGLKAGKHLLHFTAAIPDFNINVNVTYDLDVVPVSPR